jgi:glycosyltransferase involved in cell wall biosynthesis
MNGEPVDANLQEAFFLQGLNSSALVDFVADLPACIPVLAGPYFQALVPCLVNGCPGRVTVMPAFHDEPELRWAPIQRMVSNARGFLFLSDEEKALAIRVHGAHGGRRLVEAPISGLGMALPGGLSAPEALEEASLRATIRLGLPERYFLYCGRIEEAKGLDYLLPWYRRWSQLRAASREEAIPLVLVGGGNPRVVPDSPEFLHVGFIGVAEKFAVMRGAIGLINPSRMESFSYVVMESWLTGRPVIVPAQCEVTSGHVRRSKGGLAFGDEVSFDAVLDTLLDEKECRRLGESGRAYVSRNYAWPDVLDRVLAGLELAVA